MSGLKRTPLVPLFLGMAACAQLGPNVVSPAGGIVLQRPSFKVGDTWTYRNYQVLSGTLNRTWVEQVTAVNDQGIVVQRVDRIPPNNTIVRQNPEVRKFEGKTEFPPSTVGMSWREPNMEDGKRVGELDCAVIAPERIRVRAGVFDTIVTECRYSHSGENYHTVSWYAQSAGNTVRHYFLRDGKPEQVTELTSVKLR